MIFCVQVKLVLLLGACTDLLTEAMSGSKNMFLYNIWTLWNML